MKPARGGAPALATAAVWLLGSCVGGTEVEEEEGQRQAGRSPRCAPVFVFGIRLVIFVLLQSAARGTALPLLPESSAPSPGNPTATGSSC